VRAWQKTWRETTGTGGHRAPTEIRHAASSDEHPSSHFIQQMDCDVRIAIDAKVTVIGHHLDR